MDYVTGFALAVALGVGVWIGYVWGCMDGREEIAKLCASALRELDELRRMNRAEIEASNGKVRK
jgi:hypothetical protein